MLFILKNKKILILALVYLISKPIFSQKWEVGGFLGGTNYSGDISRHPNIDHTHISYGVLGRFNFNPVHALRASIYHGNISATDKNNSVYKNRNLSFHSPVTEFSLVYEFNFQPFGTEPLSKRASFYIFSGIGAYHFNPKTHYNGTEFKLQPLGTEGQNLPGGKRYSRVLPSIPFGVGHKFLINPNFTLGFEFAYRLSFTDYLDDVSGLFPDFGTQNAASGNMSAILSDRSSEIGAEYNASPRQMRGNPSIKDHYIFAGITLTYRFTPVICFGKRY